MQRILWTTAVVLSLFAACGNQTPNAHVGARAEAVSTGSGSSDSSSVVRFVQSFYDWYVPVADTSRRPAMWSVLSSGSGDLDAGLRDALRADSAFGEYGNGTGTREALNFDPFLDSQDPCAQYQVAEARKQGGEYHVAVTAVCADSTWQAARPVVVVSNTEGRWKITNVIYKETDLRSLLCEYAKRDLRHETRDRGCKSL